VEDGDNDAENGHENGTDTLEYEERIDRYTVLESYEYDDDAEQWTLVIRAQEPGYITFTPSVQREEGTGTFSIYQERVSRGTTTLTIPGPLVDGEAGINIVSDRGLDEERGVYISTGQSGSNPFDTPGTMGWLGGASVVFAMGLWAFRHRLRGGSGGPKEVWD